MNLQQLSTRLAALEASAAKLFGRKPADAGEGSGEPNSAVGEPNQADSLETLQVGITKFEQTLATTQAEIQKRDTRIEQLEGELKTTKSTLTQAQADLTAAQKTIADPKGEIAHRAGAQAALIAAKQGLVDGVGEEGGSDPATGGSTKSMFAQYQELKKTSPLKAQKFWNEHRAEITAELHNG